MTPVALPELPKPAGQLEIEEPYSGLGSDFPHMQGATTTRYEPGYSTAQVIAAVLAERAAERERLIAFVQNFKPKGYVEHHGDFMDELLAAIRNQP